MSRYPRLLVDLDRIEHNARTITKMASTSDVNVTGVTKASCSDPKAAQLNSLRPRWSFC